MTSLRHLGWGLFLGLIILLVGCVHVPVQEQRWVSKSNMQFSQTRVFRDENGLRSQTEPGAVGASSSQSVGCSACR